MSTPGAGWYPDPTDQTRMRWWDGTAWSEQVQPRPAAVMAAKKRLPRWAWVGAGVVCFLLTGGIATAVIGDRTSTPASVATASPDEDAEPVQTSGGDASTINDTSSADGMTALQVLGTIPVKGRAPKTGYSRDQFGQRWLDVDRNGCDTRNDILARDLTGIQRSGTCRVLTGMLADPYTAQQISFVRGQGTSELVQIDHVVALSDAWQKGAQQLSADQRATFANDPLNLLAVDGRSNAQKGDADAATWLPKNKDFRCAYVARQVAVKATYGLWVTQAEHDAIVRVLGACPEEPAPTSAFAKVAPVQEQPEPAPEQPAPEQSAPEQSAPVQEQPAPAPEQPTTPVPFAPAPDPVQTTPPTDVFYANCTAVRAAGRAPLHIGDPGYTRKLDRDGDGVACE